MAPEIASALIGGAGSIIGSGIDAYNSYKERKDAERRRKTAQQQLSSWESDAERILNEAMGKNIQLSDQGDLESYKQMRSSYDPSKYIYDFQPFDKESYHVEDYLNPNKEAILADVRKQILNTNIGQGLGHSSGAYEAIAQGVLNKDEELYRQALEQMNTERSFDYGAYTDFIKNKQAQLTALQQGQLGAMEQLRGDLTFDQQQQDAYLSNRLNLGNTLAQTRAQLV